MSTLKQKQKAEAKALNLECEARLLGKKGPERTAELKVIETLKTELALKHEKELEEEESKKQQQEDEDGVNGVDQDITVVQSINEHNNGVMQEKKPNKAKLRQLKKEAKEEEERKKRQDEAAKQGPSKRDLEMKAIATQLSRLGLEVSEINPDGNCLYGAISHQLRVRDGELLSVTELRTKAAEAMRTHPAMFEPFLPEGETLRIHLDKVRTNGEWGGELELKALSLALRTQIWIHRINTPTVKMGEDEGYDPNMTLHLTFHEHQFALGEHYNSAVPVTVTKNF